VLPSFNYFTESKPIYCNEHKLDGMENIIKKYCEYEGCKVTASFNYNEEFTKRFCEKHKLEGMINVKDKTCIYPNCKTRPIYNIIIDENQHIDYDYSCENKGIIEL
jgi:hypothetical protein